MAAVPSTVVVGRLERPVSLGLLAVGVILAIVAGAFAAQGHDRLTFVAALALPLAIVVLRYPWAAVLLWLAVTPFFVVGDGVAGPDTWLMWRLLIPTVLALSVGYRIVGLSRSQFRLSVIDLVLVVFIVLTIANIQLLSGNPVRMTVAFYDKIMIPIFLYWLIRVIEPRERELRQLLWVFVWLILLQTGVAVMSWVAPGLLPGPWLGRAGERAVGTVGGPGPYTVTIMVAAMFALAYLVQARSDLGRWALFGVVAAAFAGVAISLSRGSWLGAALVLVGLVVIQRGVALRLIAAGVFAILLAVGPLAGDLGFASERLGDVDTAESRILTNNAAMRMIEERPLTGFGYGNFEFFDEAYKVRIADIAVKEGSAHNTYLALAAENGLPGLVLYLFPAAWLLLLTLRHWRAIHSRSPATSWLLVFLWLAIMHQLVVTNFMDMLHASPWGTAQFWLALGLIHVLISRGSRPPTMIRVGWTIPANVKT